MGNTFDGRWSPSADQPSTTKIYSDWKNSLTCSSCALRHHDNVDLNKRQIIWKERKNLPAVFITSSAASYGHHAAISLKNSDVIEGKEINLLDVLSTKSSSCRWRLYWSSYRREDALVLIERLKLTRPLLITFAVLSSAERGGREIYVVCSLITWPIDGWKETKEKRKEGKGKKITTVSIMNALKQRVNVTLRIWFQPYNHEKNTSIDFQWLLYN
jgi:hypothetical protein